MPIYMKYGAIVGPLKGKYKGWIELVSCQFATPQYGTGGNGTLRPSLDVTKVQDTSSMEFLRELAVGTGVNATIDYTGTDKLQTVRVRYHIKDASLVGVRHQQIESGFREWYSIECAAIMQEWTVAPL